MPPFFTIVVPTYNSSQTIRRCLDSIAEQTYQSYELLIVDGLSEDDTVAIARRYTTLPLRVISEKDQGIYDAMNKGVLQSAGGWLFFLGSDDYLFNETVLDNIHQTIREIQPDFLYGNVICRNQNKTYNGKFEYRDLLMRNICHQATFIRRDVLIKQGLFDLAYPCFADWDLHLKLFRDRHVQVAYTDQIVSVYNTTGTSANNTLQDGFHTYRLSLVKKYAWSVDRLRNYLADAIAAVAEWMKP